MDARRRRVKAPARRVRIPARAVRFMSEAIGSGLIEGIVVGGGASSVGPSDSGGNKVQNTNQRGKERSPVDAPTRKGRLCAVNRRLCRKRGKGREGEWERGDVEVMKGLGCSSAGVLRLRQGGVVGAVRETESGRADSSCERIGGFCRRTPRLIRQSTSRSCRY